MQVDIDSFRNICGDEKNHEITVKDVWIEKGAVNRLYHMLTEDEELGEFIAPIIVWDENTRDAAEEAMEDIEDVCLETICLDKENLHADNYGVAIVEENMPEETDLIIAVGSGTIHDLCRYVASDMNVPFVSVPTAASMDGFVSNVAAIIWDGMKKTIPAVAPVYVFADTDIFKNAPDQLTASGVSDLIAKYIALADWKIAHLLTDEYICEEIIDMEYKSVAAVGDTIDDLSEGDEDAYEKLMYGLVTSGLAMQLIGSSRPASCAEHQLAHLWEMDVINKHTDSLHGDKVAVGILLVRRQYAKIAQAIKEDRCKVHAYEGMDMKLLEDTFGKEGLLELVIDENSPDPMQEVNPERLLEILPEVAEIIDNIPDEESLRDILKRAGCPVTMSAIGMNDSLIDISLRLSAYVKNRLSFNRISVMLEI